MAMSDFGGTHDLAILMGLMYARSLGRKIVSISFNQPTANGLENPSAHGAVHTWATDFYLNGGLIFVSAGNYGMRSFASANWASNYGNPVWFTAPGVGIACSARTGGLAVPPHPFWLQFQYVRLAGIAVAMVGMCVAPEATQPLFLCILVIETLVLATLGIGRLRNWNLTEPVLYLRAASDRHRNIDVPH